MNRPSYLTTLAALALLALAGCKPSAVPMLDITMPDTALGEELNSLDKEAQACVQHYLDTGDAAYATPEHGITMLHLAALTQRLWLVEELLAKGADVQARMRHAKGSDTPLSMAMRRYSHEAADPVKDVLMVVKRLLQAGAQLNDAEAPNLLGLAATTFSRHNRHYYALREGAMTGEDLMVYLMEQGVQGGAAEAEQFCRYGWPSALAKLMKQAPEGAELAKHSALLHLCTAKPYRFTEEGEGQFACARLLLEAGADADAPDTAGRTALHSLVDKTLHQPDYQYGEYGLPFITLLLQHGADPMKPTGRYGKSCAADLIASGKGLQKQLAEAGHSIEAPAHVFTKEGIVEQLLDIPAAAIRTDEIHAHAELLESLFAEPLHADELQQRRACAKALALLQRADAQRALAIVESFDWSDWDNKQPFARHLLYAIQETPERIIYAEWLMGEARGWAAAGRPELAHAFVMLLERDCVAEDHNEKVCKARCLKEGDRKMRNTRLLGSLCKEDNPPAIRAAALSIYLHKKGLPALGNGEVWQWLLSEHCMGPRECNAVLLAAVTADRSAQGLPESDEPAPDFEDLNATHLRRTRYARLCAPERLHFTGCGSLHTEPIIKAMRDIGAHTAADWYAQETPAPEGAAAASLDLEIALALYILKHENEFRHPTPSRFDR